MAKALRSTNDARPDSPGKGRLRARSQAAARAHDLDRVIHERVRLGIVSALEVNESLTFNELKELLALTWLGRGDFTIDEWQSGLRRVRDVRRYHTADYLLATPLLADFLLEGLAQFGLSCEEFELGRM